MFLIFLFCTSFCGFALLPRCYAAPEKPAPGDLILNEVMFHQPDSSFEYVEIYNRSDRLLDVSGMVLTTRKKDLSLNTGNKIPAGTSILPGTCLALTENADIVRKYHLVPDTARICSMKWSALNNEGAALVLTNAAKDIILDEFIYSPAMHHAFVKNPKGVALERIYVELPAGNELNWHSAASVCNYGTPGYRNSQFREDAAFEGENVFFLERDYFTPDNDGTEDVCILGYRMPEHGYIANVAVLDVGGREIAGIAGNAILAAEGTFIWNGENHSGKIVSAGIYVIFAEIIHPESGKRRRIKIPVVVTTL